MDETMEAVPNTDSSNLRAKLGSPELRSLVQRLVRRRVPEVEVDDVVQTVLCDAFASAKTSAQQADGTGPVLDDDEQLRKWVVGITRHKVADFHRRGSRVKQVELPEQLEGEPPPHSAREWAHWAEKQADGDADAERTLDWMAREGGGEKLAHIAASERLPATQVRQRVSRMRRLMRSRWMAELAAVAGVGIAVLVAWYLLRDPGPTAKPVPDVVPVPDIVPTPVPDNPRLYRAYQLRGDSLRECDRQAWLRCLAGLDEAARLDPAGDEDAQVQGARAAASRGLEAQQQMDQKQAPAPSSLAPKKPPYWDKKMNLPPPPTHKPQQLKPGPSELFDNNSSLPRDPMPNQFKSPEPPPAQPPVNDEQQNDPGPQQTAPQTPPPQPPPGPPAPQSSQQSSKGNSWGGKSDQGPVKKPRPKKKTGKTQWRTKGGK
jgi:DNA-directed RNA polymerase specialized sigma24 family protein